MTSPPSHLFFFLFFIIIKSNSFKIPLKLIRTARAMSTGGLVKPVKLKPLIFKYINGLKFPCRIFDSLVFDNRNLKILPVETKTGKWFKSIYPRPFLHPISHRSHRVFSSAKRHFLHCGAYSLQGAAAYGVLRRCAKSARDGHSLLRERVFSQSVG